MPYTHRVRASGPAAQSDKPAKLFDPATPIATDRNSTALDCLATAFDRAPHGRKGIAIDADIPEATLSKILSGVQGIPGPLLDSLDDATLVDFMRCLGRDRGIEVRLVETSEITDQLLEASQELTRVIKLAAARNRPARPGRRG